MKTIYVENLLRAAMDSALPQMAQTAIGRAETNLASIVSECLSYLDALFVQFPGEVSGDPALRLQQMREAYNTSRRMIGVAHASGFPDVDVAAKSLCDVADALLTIGSTNWDPIGLHIQTMRLLRNLELASEERSRLLAGLEDLKKRFYRAAEDQDPVQ
jgi:hypothetical protein